MHKDYIEILAIGIVCMLVGFWVGYIIGFANAISAIAEVAKPFVDVDVDLIRQAITNYETHMKDCFN